MGPLTPKVEPPDDDLFADAENGDGNAEGRPIPQAVLTHIDDRAAAVQNFVALNPDLNIDDHI